MQKRNFDDMTIECLSINDELHENMSVRLNGNSSILGKINRIVRLRVNSDGDGVRSVVFLQNCPLTCIWCCNPETRFGGRFYEKETDELYELIKRDIPYFDYSEGGVTFSGGEPLLQCDYIVEFAEKHPDIKNINIETSLYADAEIIAKIAPYIKEWIIDYKCHDEKSHIEYTGVSNDEIKRNLKWLANNIDKKKIHIAFPIIPGKNDSDENVGNMISFIKDVGLSSVYLHPYRKKLESKYQKLNLEYEDIPLVPNERLFQIQNMFGEYGISTSKRKVYVEKEKCRFLKDIRKKICSDRNIDIFFEECKYERVCSGTCPKCESELDKINEEYGRK